MNRPHGEVLMSMMKSGVGEALVPTAFVKVTTSAAVTVSIHAQASY